MLTWPNGTDSEMAEALYHHYQNVVDPENPSMTASGSGPSYAPTLLEQPPQKKKKKAIPNKKMANTTTTESVAKDLTVTEPIYVSCKNFQKTRRPEDASPVTYRNDRDIANLIERSISKLIPTIADEAVRRLNLHVVDMNITRLRDSVDSRQIGRALEWQCPADIIPAVQQRLLNQIQNGEFVEFHLLFPSHAPPLTNNYLVDIVDNNEGEPSISIGKTHSRAKIANFQSWLKAWNIYLRCMIHFHSSYHPASVLPITDNTICLYLHISIMVTIWMVVQTSVSIKSHSPMGQSI